MNRYNKINNSEKKNLNQDVVNSTLFSLSVKKEKPNSNSCTSKIRSDPILEYLSLKEYSQSTIPFLNDRKITNGIHKALSC